MPEQRLAFGPFVLDGRRGTVHHEGRPVAVSSRGFALLRALAEADGRAVTKSELMDAAWPGAAVEESNLTVQIAALRKLLGPAPSGEEWIATIPRIGYRLILPPAGSNTPEAATVPSAGLSDRLSIAVLPFVNMSSDPDQDYFAAGLAEDLITDLSKVVGLMVIARHSSFAYGGKPPDVRLVAKELGVRYIVVGSVRRAADRVRINAELIDATDSGVLWADRFDGALPAVFELQDVVVARIVDALAGALPSGPRVVSKRAANIQAYDLFVRGRVLVAHSSGNNDVGRLLLEASTSIDPGFADAHAWLAYSHHVAWVYRGELADVYRGLAREAAERAISLDAGNADAHWTLGLVRAYDLELASGIAEFETALRANPNHADAWAYMTDLLVLDGRPIEGIECARNALRLNPDPSPIYHWFLGFAQYADGRYDDAVETLLLEATRRTGSQRILAASLAQLGRVKEAKAEADEFLAGHPGFTVRDWARTQPFRREADRQHFIDGYLKAGLPH
jgi:TolB-like protein